MGDDDALYDDAVRRTGKAARLGRTVSAGVSGLLAPALIAASADLLAIALAPAYGTAGTG
ncbi:hypothetical protein [Streptomyces sp. Tu 3180]|uniref:hypothetical protein n=1 Tax=Streptomyces sp. Tu 3180 TaxID=2682611 RepID=UPI00135C808C|nr:hypothetical protein [Streptomyces sp. Tu 3180]KAF3467184.1 hypothetical protein GL259_24665 [Streptomyces sp. Tu 3180]